MHLMGTKIDNFSFEDIRRRFYCESATDNTGWTSTRVKVFDKESSTSEPVYEYDRNFSMLDTFEPFRLWDESQQTWRHFALISPLYTNFEVLDLDKRAVIAKNPNPLLTQEQADSLNRSYTGAGEEISYEAGQEFSAARFCPMSFHVPDVLDILSEQDARELREAVESQEKADVKFWDDWMNNFLQRRSFGFESGCVWGDDWSKKVQAIDLTRILEGEVSDDDRFGYFVFNGDLKDVYGKEYYDDDSQRSLSLKTDIHFHFDENDSTQVVKANTYSILPQFSYDKGQNTPSHR